MPCMYESVEEQLANYSKEVLELNRLLCEACTIIAEASLEPSMGRLLTAWWKKHQEEDRKRIERENAAKREKELRKAALKKLSPEEKRALGVR